MPNKQNPRRPMIMIYRLENKQVTSTLQRCAYGYMQQTTK